MITRTFRPLDIPTLIRQELARVTSTPLGILALIALMCVPLIYGGLYLWANKDPQGNMDELTVALVVEDKGASDEAGAPINHGSDIAERLIEDGSFGWQIVNRDEATRGVENGGFAFAVLLPDNFSTELESSGSDHPEKARIELHTNDASNAIGTTAGQRAMEELRSKVASEVGDTAALRLLDGLSEVRGGLDDAATGANKLKDGTQEAVDGSSELSDGATTLHTKLGELSDGADKLSTGSTKLSDGLYQLHTATSTLPDDAEQLATGARQVADGNALVASKAHEMSTTAQNFEDDLPNIRTKFAEDLRASGFTEEDVQKALVAVAPFEGRVSTTNAKIQEDVKQLDTLATGADAVADGAEKLSANAPALADGIAQADEGAKQLEDGAGQLATGAQQLEDGAGRLKDGTDKLHTGLTSIHDGQVELYNGLVEGRDKIPASSQELRNGQANTISDPVRVEEIARAKAQSYGAGLAPFFSTLAAWIGIYALFLVVKPFSRRAATAMWSPLRVTIAGWATPAILGAVQMGLLFVILTGLIGFHFVHPLATIAIMVLAAATFAAIIMALNVWLGSVGQFIGLVLMVIQLVAAGGTFPWQTLPAPLNVLHHLLPMSWSVEALRQTMLGGNMMLAGGMSAFLLGMLGAALGASALGITRVTSTQVMRDLAPSIIG